MKKIVLLLFSFLFSMIFSSVSFAENFHITNYDVLLDVKKNRDIHVTEHIDVFFTKSSHGIFREIPVSGNLYYENGKTAKLRAKISGITVNQKYSVSSEGSNTRIKIGYPNRKVLGPQKYVIKYVYSMGNDKLKDNDELYFNLIGQQWDTNIQDVDFKVVLPTPYENLSEKTGFSVGRSGVSGYDPDLLNFSIKDNKEIVGKVYKTLLPFEGVTIRTTLPDGYFEKSINDPEMFVLIIIPLLALIAFLMWFIWGRDETVIPIVNFYPPKNRNSAEVGVEYSGLATQKEISSLVLFLANKGYLEIVDDGISYTLNKIKDYDGKNPYEKSLMTALFNKSDIITIEELQNSSQFYMHCNAIISSLNKIRNRIFDKNATTPEKIFLVVFCLLGLLMTMVYVLGDYSFDLIFSQVPILLLFPIVGVVLMFSTLYGLIIGSESILSKIITFIFILIFGLGFIFLPLFCFILPMCTNVEQNIPTLLLNLACICVTIVCLYNMPKRNKQGRLALGHILGFKQFLEVAEKHRLESLLLENPNYVSEIIPYAYVLDVSDKIMPVLENLSMYNQPSWYKGYMTSDSFVRFGSAMVAASSPSTSNGAIRRSSGGSGFSGGGCSGGGGGGGGGGSW